MRPLDVFVSPHGNAFMRDIASWIVEAGEQTGRVARLRDDGDPPSDRGRVNLVVAPHEFFLLGEFDDATIHRAAQLSVPVCTEQPGTPWFDIGQIATAASPITIDINLHGVQAYRQLGREVRHLRLGGVPSMSAPPVERDIEVVFLGGDTTRRGVELGRLAPLLWDRDVDLRLFSFFRPVLDGAPGLVFGREKYELLARSRILLNIHRDDTRPGYFEWARMVEAMANGCCVLTEPVSDHSPYVEGVHFVVADDLAAGLTELLDDPERRARIGDAARRAVQDEYPLVSSLGPILDEIERIDMPVAASRRPPRYLRRMVVAQRHPLLPAYRAHGEFRRRAYEALQAEVLLQRKIEQARCLARHGVDDRIVEVRSAAYDSVEPEVTVVVTLFDYASLVVETLESIVASTDVALEIVVVDDHSTDDGRAVVERFVADHPDVAILLLGCEVNRGLPAARNLGFERARAAKVMVMDADNLVYPNALRQLADALDADPGAAFAYSTLEEFGASTGVRSAMAWNVPRLCDANYIDAQAMLRRSTWERHGGYRVDDELVFGWEDWELWLRLAAAGEHGVHVPRMLGRYRTQAQSMLSTTNLVADHMLRHVRELYPDLPWP